MLQWGPLYTSHPCAFAVICNFYTVMSSMNQIGFTTDIGIAIEELCNK